MFEKTLAAVEKLLAADEIVLVRGRVDHKEAGKSCIIVQDAERFDPSDAEIEKAKEQVARLAANAVPEPTAPARRRRAPAAGGDRGAARPVRALSGRPEFVLEMHTRAGVRCLRFGDGYKVAGP